MGKKQTVKEVAADTAAKDQSTEQVRDGHASTDAIVPNDEKATVAIPEVVKDIDKADVTPEEITLGAEVDPEELAFGMLDDETGVKYKIDPFEVENALDAANTFRSFFSKFRKKKHTSPNVLYINTQSLERLGWKDIASELGLTLQTSTTYHPKEMVLALK